MTKIVLLSDTHGFLDPKVIKHVKLADEVWHAGDIGSLEVTDKLGQYATVRGVYGNIDNNEVRQEFPEYIFFTVDELKVLMIHIGGYPGTYNPKTRKLIEKYNPDLVIVGHSHILKVMQDKHSGHLHMNPGAAGIHGFHKFITLLRFEIHKGKISKLEAVELGKRGMIN